MRWLSYMTLAMSIIVGVRAQTGDKTYAAVVAGMKCNQEPSGQLVCDYRVGRSLHLAVVGVGEPDATITVFRASDEDDYYASVGVAHRCAIVRPGAKLTDRSVWDVAYISPRNGKVFVDWKTCQDAR